MCSVATVTITATAQSADGVGDQAYKTISTSEVTIASGPKLSIDTNRSPLVVLGTLLGLSVMVLITMTIGWMWTCWTMKRKYKTKKRL